MIHDIIEVVEKIIDLLHGRSAHARQLFTDHVQPIYEELCRVDADYRNLFSETVDVTTREDTPYATILTWLRIRKRELEPLRTKVDALAAALIQHRALPAEVLRFCENIRDYFCLSAETAPESFFERGGTGYSTLIWEIESAMHSGNQFGAERLARRVSELSDELTQRFRDITVAYAEARANSLR
jgi:hypothetical protein